ncbi:hypothetical protein [Kordia sp.]|uniref:hypothetical protein n=1 Tax=Kordia sp. TaxID=1965332 RepID=UPI003B5AD716
MNRKEFIKYTALGSTATLLIPAELHAFTDDWDVDKWYYGRSVYGFKKDSLPGKTFYKYNSLLFQITQNPIGLKAKHEVLIADKQGDFPLGSFAIYRTEYTYYQKEKGSMKLYRKGVRRDPKLLTRRSFPDSFFRKKDDLFLHPRMIDVSQLGTKGDKKVRIEYDNEKDSFFISGQFDMNAGKFIKTGKNTIIAPYSHRTDAWIKMDELQHKKEIEAYFTANGIDFEKPALDVVADTSSEKTKPTLKAFSDNSKNEVETVAEETPKRRSFLDNYKKRQTATDKVRSSEYARYHRKYQVREYEDDKEFFKILHVTLSGSLRKGQVLKFTYLQSQTISETLGKSIKWERSYKLLDDFEPKRTIRIQNVSGKNEGFVDKFESIRCYITNGSVRNATMQLTYSGGRRVNLVEQW